MRSDGTRLRRLTNTPKSSETAPAWSPDGRRLAFVRTGAEEIAGLVVLDLARGTQRTITAAGPSWRSQAGRVTVARSPSPPTTKGSRSTPCGRTGARAARSCARPSTFTASGTAARHLPGRPAAAASPTWRASTRSARSTPGRSPCVPRTGAVGSSRTTCTATGRPGAPTARPWPTAPAPTSGRFRRAAAGSRRPLQHAPGVTDEPSWQRLRFEGSLLELDEERAAGDAVALGDVHCARRSRRRARRAASPSSSPRARRAAGAAPPGRPRRRAP